MCSGGIQGKYFFHRCVKGLKLLVAKQTNAKKKIIIIISITLCANTIPGVTLEK